MAICCPDLSYKAPWYSPGIQNPIKNLPEILFDQLLSLKSKVKSMWDFLVCDASIKDLKKFCKMNNNSTFKPLNLTWRDHLYGGFDIIPADIIEENMRKTYDN